MPPTGRWPTEAGPGIPLRPGVVYVSPLRALTVDVHENLQRPLAGIAEEAARLGLAAPDLSVAVRTGDTPAGGAGGHAPFASRPPGHHAGVPLPASHGGIVEDHARKGCTR